MGKWTIAQVKEKLAGRQLAEHEWTALKQDTRKGVQKLLLQYERLLEKEQLLKVKYQEMMAFEKKQYQAGKQYVAGVDEAGRGPLAGPVVAGCVILHKDYYLEGLNDSKQLSHEKREMLFERITADALAYGIGEVTNEEIDRYNIYEATKMAMRRAVSNLGITPDHLLIDAVKLEGMPCTKEALIKGDQRSVSIAAGSIVAKVTRDRMMAKIHEEFPMYDFQSNQGYGTSTHMKALEQFGPSPYHRYSFSPVAAAIRS
ncbi:ribonuclease HII [Thalassobacillus devorans]|uniref:Ribonuclease HII n=1 Tax=Thalassobacillus devorans TaxID=279813 RepID=A0ABQ1P4E4_9BACI|nr:ribonuclease HII [Thalassobacillus devorans]NIK27895.1 ribonuclease HII [Thalassobacillus devorans]GGC90522.1 ribonuclease HII [Thalassobacillus devorans]